MNDNLRRCAQRVYYDLTVRLRAVDEEIERLKTTIIEIEKSRRRARDTAKLLAQKGANHE